MNRHIARGLAAASLAAAAALVSSLALAVDTWDSGPFNDNTAASTRNELARGEWQQHDLEAIGGVADEDWFVLAVSAFRTHQVFLNQIAGDTPIDNSDFLTLWDATGTTLLQTANASPGATSKVIRWSSDAATSYRIRVKGGATSSSNAKYSILYSETTLYCPRYNQTGTQTSVVIIQNTTNASCSMFVSFINETGAFVNGTPANANGAGMVVLSAGGVASVPGTKGSVQILPNCSPSALKAKVVALEPSTGFSFDTVCSIR